MKKVIIYINLFVSTLILACSCSKELQKTNVNPNNLEKPDAGTLLSNTIVTAFYNNANFAWNLGNGYGQYMTFSSSYYNQATRYSPVTNEPYWVPMFEAARDANTLYNLGVSQKNPLLQAISLTLRSYAFAQLTELWGDIPFLQALKGNTGLYTPSYDSQQTVYMDPGQGILPSLRRADSLLKAFPTGLISGDLLFNVNASNPSTLPWRRFVNALRLRYLLRVSSKVNVGAEMQSIADEGAIMQSAANSGVLALPVVTPYNFVSLTERSGDFAVKFMNSTLYNAYTAAGDSARMATYFAPRPGTPATAPFSFSNYGGMPIVVDASSGQTGSSSNFNPSFVSGSNKNLIRAKVITYAEQQFALAEAALKGLINGDAAALYNAGVKGAFAEDGLDAAAASNYLAHPGVQFNNTSVAAGMNNIITQKWIANINNGFEGWIEYRRTGYPAFQTGDAANLNGGAIPSRFLYPVTEQTINSVNYTKELQQMGGKETTTYKAWWEK